MEYKGKKIGFKRTVGAVSEITKLAPGGNVKRLMELFSEEDLSQTLESAAKFLAILNKWYEKSLVFEIEGYKPDPVPADWYMLLDFKDFMSLLEEAMSQFAEDDKTTVEAEEPKGKKNE